MSSFFLQYISIMEETLFMNFLQSLQLLLFHNKLLLLTDQLFFSLSFGSGQSFEQFGKSGLFIFFFLNLFFQPCNILLQKK